MTEAMFSANNKKGLGTQALFVFLLTVNKTVRSTARKAATPPALWLID
jgi:hypothetical protein